MVVPLANIYHVKKRFQKNFNCRRDIVSRNFSHLIVNKTRNIHCITVKFGMELPLIKIYHVKKSF